LGGASFRRNGGFRGYDLNGDKVSGLDNFSMAFLWSCWDVIKVDVMKVFLKWRKQKKKKRKKKKKEEESLMQHSFLLFLRKWGLLR